MRHRKQAPILLWLALVALGGAFALSLSERQGRAQLNVDLAAIGRSKTAPELLKLARDIRTRHARTRVIVQ